MLAASCFSLLGFWRNAHEERGYAEFPVSHHTDCKKIKSRAWQKGASCNGDLLPLSVMGVLSTFLCICLVVKILLLLPCIQLFLLSPPPRPACEGIFFKKPSRKQAVMLSSTALMLFIFLSCCSGSPELTERFCRIETL